jgi:hypothetical protein
MKNTMDAAEKKGAAQLIRLGEDLALPWDLREWFDGSVLRQWILAEFDSLDWNNPDVLEYLRQRPGFQPKSVLCLLTFAYATGVFESDEIERKGHSDPEYEAIVGAGWRGEGRLLTRFRRECRGLLKWALVQLFKQALRARLGDVMLPAGLKRRLVDAAVMRLDLAHQMDRGYEGW